ncbi:MAG: nitroreductase [Candidatus Aminicenantia bacterium]
MEIIEAIQKRRSIRAFKPDPVPREIIEKILKTALRSPSYTNSQPWEIIVVCGENKDELSKELLKYAEKGEPIQPDIPKPLSWPDEIRERVDEHFKRRHQTLGIAEDDKEKKRELRLANFRFFGAPAVIFLLQDASLTMWSAMDMGMFAMAIMLSALEFGLHTCPQGSLTEYSPVVKKILEIPENKRLMLGISIGYPDWDAKINQYISSRISLEKITKWIGF